MDTRIIGNRSDPEISARVICVMAGAGPLSIREVARRVGRDVRAVHSDVHLLHHAGVLDKTEDGRVILPYKAIKFDFTLDARKAA